MLAQNLTTRKQFSISRKSDQRETFFNAGNVIFLLKND